MVSVSSKSNSSKKRSLKSKKSAVHPAAKGTVDSTLAVLQSSLTGFDPSGSFLFVQNAGAAKGWKVFDVVSKAVLMESVSSQVTTFSWISRASDSDSSLNKRRKKKSTRKEEASPNVPLLAVGSSCGKVIVYDVAAAKDLNTFICDSRESILALCCSSDSNDLLYALDASKSLSTWNLADGKQVSSLPLKAFLGSYRDVSCMASLSAEKLLVVAGSIHLLNLTNGLFEKKFLGHEGSIDQIVCIGSDAFISKSKQDRSVLVWNESSCDPKKVLNLDHPCLSLDLWQLPSSASKILACIDISGTFYLYSGQDFSSFTKISFENSASSAKIPVFAVRLLGQKMEEGSVESVNLVVARGSCLFPEYEQMSSVELNGVQVFKRIFDGNLLLGEKMNTMVKDVRAESLAYSESKANVSSATDLDISKELTDVSMKDRLKALGINENDTEEDQKIDGKKPSQLPKADSLCNMLTQALHTNDNSLLEQVLAVTDKGLVENTVKSLNPSFIVSFLNQIVFRFQKRYKRGTALYCWIRAILKLHASSLLTIPNLPKALKPLYKTVENRLSFHTSLLELSGRLDLVIDQIDSRNRLSSANNQSGQTGFLYQEDEELDQLEMEASDENDDNDDDEEEEDFIMDEGNSDEDEEMINISESEAESD